MKHYMSVTKALSDPTRVRLFCALREGELCVCQLIGLVDLAPSTVSKHLSILHQAELLESRKEGRWVYYRLPQKPRSDFAGRMTRETFRALDTDEQIARDRTKLNAIQCIAPEVLCRTQ